jgi:hypothetical protein
MIARNVVIALVSAVVGAVLTLFVLQPGDMKSATAKSDRLGGTSTETAFLPERFGVPGSTH